MKKRKVLVGWLVVALGVSSASVAAAVITSSTGSVTRLSAAPPSVKLNALESATAVQAFDERQSFTLPAAVAVDAVNPGTYTAFPSGSATIAAGTIVDSHLIHSDIPSSGHPTTHRTGTVTFSDNILGVVASTARLVASDTLGAPTTLYEKTSQWRGLEGSVAEDHSTGGDKFTISADRRTLTFDIQTLVMDEIRVITRPSLTTTITDSPDPVQAGDNVTYTVTVSNHGSAAVAGVQLQDQFPGATLVSAVGPTVACTGTSTVTCAMGTIAAGGSAVATIVVTSPSTSGTIVNTATAPPGLNPASATTAVISPTLNTAIDDAPDPVTVGNDVRYTLTVTNNGLASVANAHVIDNLPPGTTFKSASPGCSGTGPVDCTLGTIAVLGSAGGARR